MMREHCKWTVGQVGLLASLLVAPLTAQQAGSGGRDPSPIRTTAKSLSSSLPQAFGLNQALGRTAPERPPMVIQLQLADGTYRVKVKDGEVSATQEGLGNETVTVERRAGVYLLKSASDGRRLASLQLLPAGLTVSAAPPRRAALGVALDDIGPTVSSQLGLEDDEGVRITAVTEGGAAEGGGVQPHDIILEIDGQSAINLKKLTATLRKKRPGDRVNLVVLRRGKRKPLAVELGEWSEGEGTHRWLMPGQLGDGDITQRLSEPGYALLRANDGQDAAAITLRRDHEFFEKSNRKQRWAKSFLPGGAKSEPEASSKPNANAIDLGDRLDRLSQRLEQMEKVLEEVAQSLESRDR